MSEAQQRDLKFESFQEIAQDADNLLQAGYSATGKWNLAQSCLHLEDWLRFQIDGFPTPPLPIKILMWGTKVMAGKRMLKNIMTHGFPKGSMTAPETVYQPDAASDQDGVDKLKATIERLEKHEGEFHTSPLFGRLTREQVIQLQLLHCAHHLNFLIPKQSS